MYISLNLWLKNQFYFQISFNEVKQTIGEPEFSISIFAFNKVRGRIQNGKEDVIPYYLDGYIEAVEKGKETGYCATKLMAER
ncbi:hypothetical protein GC098_07755 [Paenibacillus sp. LMG 31458]|uniref:Uncharacterized protein n=1 Tax=Paenibacillus phytorum TaxID=2654977 RepID=A0ABX1XU46_9BACL|nr:hypothetical protein [Paenibacillus phytorum]NOU71314.1 hypothetical protein [Paenibacillus phytorum]